MGLNLYPKELREGEAKIICSFCGKPKFSDGNANWISNIRITHVPTKKVGFVSVCHECRKKYTIWELYGKITGRRDLWSNMKYLPEDEEK